MSVDDKVTSSLDLYRQVLASLNIRKDDRVLEIGCGRGHGAALALTEFGPSEVHGVDAIDFQINAAGEDNADLIAQSKGKLFYKQGSGAEIPYADGSFEKVYSLEALFGPPEQWLAEIYRVARNSARLALSSVFVCNDNVTWKQLAKVLAPRESLEKVHAMDDSHAPWVSTIDYVVQKVKDAGFTNVASISIGEHVWHGFHKWVEQAGVAAFELDSGIYRRWICAYQQGLCDYYLVTADLIKHTNK